MFTKYLSFIVLGYLSGSIMFSYLIVKVLKHIDLIDVSDDHNPGMANAFKYGGTTCGVLALVCDFFKAFLPIFFSLKFLDYDNLLFILVLVAPVLGHAYPIYMGLKNGGKCILSSFGILFGLIPDLLPFCFLAFWFIFFSVVLIIKPHALRTVITFICWFLSYTIYDFFFVKKYVLLVGFLIMTLLIFIRHKKSLKECEDKEIHFVFSKN